MPAPPPRVALSPMDPRTAMVVATLMMLLNGGVLGLMHRDLPRDARPSAVDWRIGTLLLAAGSLLLAVQDSLPTGFVLPLANGALLGGLALYWRAVRRFDGREDTPWLFLPALAGTLGIFVFAALRPNLPARVAIATAMWVVLVFGAGLSLRSRAHSDAATSRRVLAAIFFAMGGFMLARVAYYLLHPTTSTTVIDTGSWINLLTPVVVTVMPVIGTTAFLLLCSERIRRQWERAAVTDELTGLANRRSTLAAGRLRFAAARQGQTALAVALVDIDHFKRINDRYGHDAGDRALRHVAAALQRACPPPALLGRQGGEEFVALLDCADSAAALAAAERLRQSVAADPVPLPEARLPVTVSIGVALIQPQDADLDAVLGRADRALYAAKDAGRDAVRLG